MKAVVFKYQFPLEEKFSLPMKEGANILKVEMQNGQPCMWALVNKENDDELRYFRIYGTGHEIKESELFYRGSVLTSGGMFVWHLFEIPATTTPLNVA